MHNFIDSHFTLPYTIYMTISPKKKKEKEALYRLAYDLVRQGFSFREVGRQLGKSHEWARFAFKKIRTVDNS
mgnify:CR=1 FL=1